ncbi:hypothetical protein M758_4G082100 [Ceratodon purpureus]|nr:hypothetical protein M758_4G082100 [Ceratodon purpureus]
MVSRMSSMMLTAGRGCLLAGNHHGIARQRRLGMWRRQQVGFSFVSDGKVSRRGYGKESYICLCRRVDDEDHEEVDVSNVGLPQDVFGSSSQVEAFSRLPSTVPWGTGVVASTMVIFWAGFHIPLGLGGLDIVAKVIPEQFVDPQTQAVSLVFVQLLELAGTMWLIKSTLQPFGPLPDCFNFRFDEVWRNRGWLPASASGLLVLLVAVAATASVTQDVSSSEISNGSSALTTLLSSTPLARLAIYVAYCGLTPFLEEYVYRGFLLTFLGTRMRWPFAVMISALVFSISHLSPPGFLSLFWVGCCLGTAYTWNGNLATSVVIHSLYNAIVLTKALLY